MPRSSIRLLPNPPWRPGPAHDRPQACTRGRVGARLATGARRGDGRPVGLRRRRRQHHTGHRHTDRLRRQLRGGCAQRGRCGAGAVADHRGRAGARAARHCRRDRPGRQRAGGVCDDRRGGHLPHRRRARGVRRPGAGQRVAQRLRRHQQGTDRGLPVERRQRVFLPYGGPHRAGELQPARGQPAVRATVWRAVLPAVVLRPDAPRHHRRGARPQALATWPVGRPGRHAAVQERAGGGWHRCDRRRGVRAGPGYRGPRRRCRRDTGSGRQFGFHRAGGHPRQPHHGRRALVAVCRCRRHQHQPGAAGRPAGSPGAGRGLFPRGSARGRGAGCGQLRHPGR